MIMMMIKRDLSISSGLKFPCLSHIVIYLKDTLHVLVV